MSEFRVEIPVEISAHSTGLAKLESELTRLYASAQRVSTAGSAAMSQMGSGATAASAGMQGVAAGAQEAAAGYAQAGAAAQAAGAEASAAASNSANAAGQMGQAAEKAADSVEKIGSAAQQAGSEASSGLEQASGAADKFSARMEKTEQSIRKMVGQKIQLAMEAIDKVTPVLTSIKNSVKNLASKAWKVTVKMVDFVTAPFRALKNMIMSPIMMTLGITGIGMGAGSFISTFKDFTAGMSNVKALSGATTEEFQKLTETAETLGATTKFTATEASEGMQYLAMAGWKTNDIIAAMPGLLDLAAAGQTSLGTAADIVSDVMTAMGMSADEASRAADIFARTATGSNTTIENLGESLKYAAPAAHAFGLSLSEAATITGMMANAGVKGSMAGTALRASLLEMASPSKKALEAMSKLNLTFADSSGKMKDMKTIIKDLSTAFSGLSEQEKLGYAEDLFGTRGSSAWLAVIEQGADEFDRLFESIDKSNGAAKEMANTQLDNLAGDVTLLQSAVDGMKISVMKELDPYLRKGVQWLTGKIPVITEKLTSVAKTAIEKFGQVKDFVVGVFNSPDFKNADGFADKLFVAWDKIIAEPFQKWWEGGGKDTILNLVGKIGKNLGEVYHGVISGIFAALKGEEIDFEGLNLTGLAKAGAEAAKAFIDNFKEAFDLGGLWNDMPGLLKAGLLGFGALKIGGGVIGLIKTIGQLKLAFVGLPTAASGAGAAITGVGAKAVAGTGMLAKFGVGLKAVGTALSAIPVWGWVAAAAVAAVAAGVILYNKAQAAHEQALLNTGKAALQYEDEYVSAANSVSKAMQTMSEIKEIEIRIKENKGGNQEVIKEVQEEVDSIVDRIVYVTAQLGDGTLTEAQAKEYQSQLEEVKGKIADVKAKLASGTLTQAEVTQYQAELEELKGKEAELKAALASGTLTKSDAEKYQKELESALKDYTATITATLNSAGYDTATAKLILDQYNGVVEGSKEIALILSTKTDLTAEEIQTYIHNLNELMKTKTEKELFIRGHGLSAEEIGTMKDRLAEIKDRKAKIEIEMSNGDESHVKEYQQLLQEEGVIKTQLEGAEASIEKVNEVKEELAGLKGEAEGILLKIGYDPGSDLKQEDINTIAQVLAGMGDKHYTATVALENAGMNVNEIQALIDKQNELYRNMVMDSGGVFTEKDLQNGRISQEDYDWYINKKTQEAEIAMKKAELAVAEGEKNVPELVERKNEQKADLREREAAIKRAKEDAKIVDDYSRQAESDLLDLKAGKITNDQYQAKAVEAYTALQEKVGWNGGVDFAGMSFGDFYDQWMTGSLGDWNDKVQQDRQEKESAYETSKGKYDETYGALKNQYDSKVRLAEQKAFAGFGFESGLTTLSAADIAGMAGSLDKEGLGYLTDALAQIKAINKDSQYMKGADMTLPDMLLWQAQDAMTAGAKQDVLGDVVAQMTELKAQYEQFGDMPDAAKNIENVNKALSSLGIDTQITDLSQIGDAIDKIKEIKPEDLDFEEGGAEALVAALAAMGGDAETAKTKLSEAKAAADALAGEYEVKVKYITEGSLPDAPENARGGIYDGAFLSWVAEDGPEAIIPLGNDKRNRGLDLWLQAGRALGVTEFADGGLMAPYTGLLDDDSIPDDYGDERDLPSPGRGSGGSVVVQVNADVSPTFQIDGGDGEDIIEKLKAHQKELAEMFGGAIADQLEDIVANMV